MLPMHVLNIALFSLQYVSLLGGGGLNLGKGAAREGGWGVTVDDVTFIKKIAFVKYDRL